MPYRTRRRVLNHCPMEEEIDLVAQWHDWGRVYEAEQDFDKGRGREVNWGVTGQLTLGYLESHLANVCCVLAVGAERDAAEQLMSTVDTSIAEHVVTLLDLLGQIQLNSDPRALALALIQAGFGAPLEYDEEFFEAFRAACTSHPIYNVRSIAIASTVYMEWPEFLPMLRSIESDDADERVRNRATVVRSAYEAAGLDS